MSDTKNKKSKNISILYITNAVITVFCPVLVVDIRKTWWQYSAYISLWIKVFYSRKCGKCDPFLRWKVILPKFFREKCLILISSFSSSSAKRFRTTRNFWVGFGSFLAKSAMWNSSNSSGPVISICLIKWPNTLKYFFVALLVGFWKKIWLGLLQGLNRKNHWPND